MAKNLYEILCVDKSADAAALKRAYYTLVKKTPPEKFPAEFRELRSAYETLSDPAKRAEYDEAAELPKDAAYMLEQAKKLDGTGRPEQAADVYNKLIKRYPGLLAAKIGLARVYDGQGKYGSSVKMWEKICAEEPGNADYALELALSYDFRGWRKKAITQYRLALELDDGNAKCWSCYLQCLIKDKNFGNLETAAGQAAEALRSHGRENFTVYFTQAMLAFRSDDGAKVITILDLMLNMLQTGRVERDGDPESTVATLLDLVMTRGNPALLDPVLRMAEYLPHKSGELRENLRLASMASQIEKLSGEGYHDVFADLFLTILEFDGGEEDENDITAMECQILYEAKALNTQILRLKTEKPLLYALHDEFFGEVLRARDTQKLLFARVKAMAKRGVSPNFLDAGLESAPVATVRREGPKIGRNDPCPCGSGKKYKKCCGA